MQLPQGASTTQVDFDGGRLAGMLTQPPDTPQGRILVAGATGVPQRFYRHFAAWLAMEHRQSVLTFDYSGFGASARTLTRDCTATMVDWGLRDVSAALGALQAYTVSGPTVLIGHSLGGLLLSRMPGLLGVDKIICVASGPVHLGDHPWPYRALATSFWYGHGPLMVRALGYLPGRLSGFGTDLPASVYWQWRKWCIRKGSFATDDSVPAAAEPAFCGHARFVASADDPMVPPAAVWRLMKEHPAAWHSQATLQPSVANIRTIGHLRMFSPEGRSLWPQILGPVHSGVIATD